MEPYFARSPTRYSLQITENIDAAVMGIDRQFIDLCIFEIVASDNRSVEEALAAYNQSLFSGTGDGNSSRTELMSDAVRQILGAVFSQTCPGQPSCSGRGTCQNSVCTCSEGNALLSVYFAARNNPCYLPVSCYVRSLLPPPRRICNRRCFFGCLFVCLLVSLLATLHKTSERICMKFSGEVGNGLVNKWSNFYDGSRSTS